MPHGAASVFTHVTANNAPEGQCNDQQQRKATCHHDAEGKVQRSNFRNRIFGCGLNLLFTCLRWVISITLQQHTVAQVLLGLLKASRTVGSVLPVRSSCSNS